MEVGNPRNLAPTTSESVNMSLSKSGLDQASTSSKIMAPTMPRSCHQDNATITPSSFQQDRAEIMHVKRYTFYSQLCARFARLCARFASRPGQLFSAKLRNVFTSTRSMSAPYGFPKVRVKTSHAFQLPTQTLSFWSEDASNQEPVILSNCAPEQHCARRELVGETRHAQLNSSS